MAKVLGVTLFLASLGLGGCASVQPESTTSEYCSRVDCVQMALVDQAATQHGVDVLWIHPPLRN